MNVGLNNICFALLFLCFALHVQSQEIEGVNVMPAYKEVGDSFADPILALNASWISLVTYQYGIYDNKYYPEFGYETKDQKWGETMEGIEQMIVNAKSKGLKVMLKPSVWFPSYGWPGDFKLEKESDWKNWEQEYGNYLVCLAELAEKQEVELFCMSTEMKKTIELRPQFWDRLIEDIRTVYSGKLTYAANWDNFDKIKFWDQLDYIGIDAYFPLSENATPEVDELKKLWNQPFKQIESFQKKYKKKVIFTEYGYRSINHATWRQWEFENLKNLSTANHQAQRNGYQAIFETFWGVDWFAGGFLWNWSPYDEVAGGPNNDEYTPQNKPTEAYIGEWYAK